MAYNPWSSSKAHHKRHAKRSSKKRSPKKAPPISFARDRAILKKLRADGTDTLAPLSRADRQYWKYRTSTKGIQKAATIRTENLYRDAQDVSGLGKNLLEGVGFPMQERTNHLNDALAWEKDGKISYTPTAAVWLGSPSVNKEDRQAAKRLALHELAHLGQSEEVPWRQNEGRAVRYEAVVGNRLGVGGPLVEPDDYKRWARASRSQDPRRRVLYGQFNP